MKVCIIGGTGTISSPIVELLTERENIDITLINRGNNKHNFIDVEHFKADINDTKTIKAFLEDKYYDVVINFINYLPEEIKRDIDYFKQKTDQYIFISTNVVLNHEDNLMISEDTERGNSISTYGQNKAKCEEVLEQEEDFPYTIVRPSHTYSNERFPLSVKAKNTWTVIDRIIRGEEVIVHDSGQSIWPITHANDFARLFISLVGHKQAINNIYHIMNPRFYRWDDIYREISRQVNKEYKPVYISTDILAATNTLNFDQGIRGDKKFSNIFSIDKILRINPGFEFEYNLKRGVRTFLEYMDENDELKTVDQELNEYTDELIKKYKNFIQEIKNSKL